MTTLVGRLDELFGYSFISFLRDPQKDTVTVSVTAVKVADLKWPMEGWRYVMGAKYLIRTMTETQWEKYLDERLNPANQ